ncbi:transcriptional regulator [Vibrio phage D81]
MSFGQSLQAAMEDKGIKQEELAKGVDKKQATISGYVNDKIDPGLSTVKKIAKFLDMSTSELLDYKKAATDE